MIPKYFVTLAAVVVVVTFAAASLKFAASSQVLSGKGLDEKLSFEFTVDEDKSHTYEISPEMAQFLQTHVGFHTDGPLRLVSARVEVTPESVSWTENRTDFTAPGAAMTVQLQWDTPSDSANGSRGSIYLDFPQIPGLEGKTTTIHSGAYQVDNAGRYVIREATTYRGASLVELARFVFALSAGLPFGILLHTIGWAFVLKGEKRSRISELPAQGAGLPRTFYPNPIAEWVSWLLVLGIGACVASIPAGLSISDGFMSSTMLAAVYIILAITTAITILIAHFTGRSVLTVRVGPEGIFYARGRENLEWLSATWNDILSVTHKWRRYRGNTTYWTEIEFYDNRKKLNIGQSIVGYSMLRDLLSSMKAR